METVESGDLVADVLLAGDVGGLGVAGDVGADVADGDGLVVHGFS